MLTPTQRRACADGCLDSRRQAQAAAAVAFVILVALLSAACRAEDAAAGVACWDLNENRISDPAEDLNRDGRVDVADCKAADGNTPSPETIAAILAADPVFLARVSGRNGVRGAPGVPGAKGTPGDTGPTGETGPTGASCFDANPEWSDVSDCVEGISTAVAEVVGAKHVLKSGDSMQGTLALFETSEAPHIEFRDDEGEALGILGRDVFSGALHLVTEKGVGLQLYGGAVGLRLDADTGFVGLGTPAPFAKLHIRASNGGLSFPEPGTNLLIEGIGWEPNYITLTRGTKQGIFFGDEWDGPTASIVMDHMSWRLNVMVAGEERMSILQTGLVGVGTAEPEARLDVFAKGASTALAVRATSGAAAFLVKATESDDDLALTLSNSSGAEKVVLAAAGDSALEGGGLSVGGSITVQGDVCCASDRRLKHDIRPLVGGVTKLTALRPVSYLWKDLSRGTEREMGLLAQEVEDVLPMVVRTDDVGLKYIAYGKLVPLLVRSVQELHESNVSLEARVAHLERLLSARALKSDSAVR